MKKLLLLTITLPMGLSASEKVNTSSKKVNTYWPIYDDLGNTKNNYIINGKTEQSHPREVYFYLDYLFTHAGKLEQANLAAGQERRTRNGCQLKDVVQEGTGNTLLHAVALCEGDPDVVAYLLKLGLNPSLKNNQEPEGKTALDLANGELVAALAAATIDKMQPPKKANPVDNSNHEPFEPEKKATWSSYITFENGVLTAVGLCTVHYAWHHIFAKEKATG